MYNKHKLQYADKNTYRHFSKDLPFKDGDGYAPHKSIVKSKDNGYSFLASQFEGLEGHAKEVEILEIINTINPIHSGERQTDTAPSYELDWSSMNDIANQSVSYLARWREGKYIPEKQIDNTPNPRRLKTMQNKIKRSKSFRREAKVQWLALERRIQGKANKPLPVKCYNPPSIAILPPTTWTGGGSNHGQRSAIEIITIETANSLDLSHAVMRYQHLTQWIAPVKERSPMFKHIIKKPKFI